MEDYKENFIKKFLKDFEEKCKELGAKYVIAVGGEIRIHASPTYLANIIMETLKSLPSKGRQCTITLLLELLEKEIEEE